MKPCKAWFKQDNDFNTEPDCKFYVLVGMFHRPKHIESDQQFTLNWRKEIVCNRITTWTDYGKDTFSKIKRENPLVITQLCWVVLRILLKRLLLRLEKVTPLTSRYTSESGKLKRRRNQEDIFIVIVKGFFDYATTGITALAVITIALVRK